MHGPKGERDELYAELPYKDDVEEIVHITLRKPTKFLNDAPTHDSSYSSI